MIDNKVLASYVDAMIAASATINHEDPDFVVAPMLGSIPFIDAMAIVDSNFDPARVVYMPASSRIDDVNTVIRDWYFNFLEAHVKSPDFFPRVVGIDEVVSGSSVMRCLKNIDQAVDMKKKRVKQNLLERLHSPNPESAIGAIRDIDLLSESRFAKDFAEMIQKVKSGAYKSDKPMANRDTLYAREIVKSELASRLTYRTIGIEDSKSEGKRAFNYEVEKTNKRVIPIPVKSILTMDVPGLCPARFAQIEQPKGRDGYVQFLPTITDFKITPQYLEFLRVLSKFVGKDADRVAPVNMSAILDSSRYLPK